MTYTEIDGALIQILSEKKTACKERIDRTPNENKKEKKLLHLELGMYTLCQNAGFLVNTTGGREGVIRTRRKVIGQILSKHPSLQSTFDSLGEEDQLTFVAALQAELFLRDQFLPAYREELASAMAAKDTDGILEMQIKIGALENVFGAWALWRQENGVFPALIEVMK